MVKFLPEFATLSTPESIRFVRFFQRQDGGHRNYYCSYPPLHTENSCREAVFPTLINNIFLVFGAFVSKFHPLFFGSFSLGEGGCVSDILKIHLQMHSLNYICFI